MTKITITVTDTSTHIHSRICSHTHPQSHILSHTHTYIPRLNLFDHIKHITFWLQFQFEGRQGVREEMKEDRTKGVRG